MSLVVTDIGSALMLYRGFFNGPRIVREPDWIADAAFTTVRSLPAAEYRTHTIDLPGTTLALELIEYRGLPQTPYRPVFQDIGFGHIAFNTNDIEAFHAAMQQQSMTTLSASGTWTQINPTLRAIYTRDHDGFFLENIENHAPQP